MQRVPSLQMFSRSSSRRKANLTNTDFHNSCSTLNYTHSTLNNTHSTLRHSHSQKQFAQTPTSSKGGYYGEALRILNSGEKYAKQLGKIEEAYGAKTTALKKGHHKPKLYKRNNKIVTQDECCSKLSPQEQRSKSPVSSNNSPVKVMFTSNPSPPKRQMVQVVQGVPQMTLMPPQHRQAFEPLAINVLPPQQFLPHPINSHSGSPQPPPHFAVSPKHQHLHQRPQTSAPYKQDPTIFSFNNNQTHQQRSISSLPKDVENQQDFHMPLTFRKGDQAMTFKDKIVDTMNDITLNDARQSKKSSKDKQPFTFDATYRLQVREIEEKLPQINRVDKKVDYEQNQKKELLFEELEKMREEDLSIRKRCIDDLGYLIARFDVKKEDLTGSQSMRGSRSNRGSRKNLFTAQK